MSDTHDRWPPWPTPTSRPPSQPPWSATEPAWLIGDMRERLATLEAEHRHTATLLRDRAQAQDERMSRIDARLTEGDRRMTETDSRLASLETERRRCLETETGLKALGDRVLTIEHRRLALVNVGYYVGAAFIGWLTVTGRIDAETALKWTLRLLGIG